VILVNPAKHPGVRRDLGQQFIDWLISAEGQNAIASCKINGQQLFLSECGRPKRLNIGPRLHLVA
jgi:tungstate transport system substrate-binding protein